MASLKHLIGGALLGLTALTAQATELNMWVMSTTEAQQQDMQDLLKPYLDSHPGLRINVTVLNWEAAWSKITVAAVSGHGPDILELGTTWVASLAAMGALEPLSDEQLRDVGGPAAFYPALWGTTHPYNDKRIYAVPWYADARAMFYRTDVFKAAGVDPSKAFANWTTFKAALQKVNGTTIGGRKVAALGYPGKNDWNVVHNLAPWIWSAGGDVLTPDLQHSALNSPQSLQAINYYTDLAASGLVPRDALEKDSGQIESGFYNGDYAVIFGGPWILRPMHTPKAKGGQLETVTAQNFNIAPFPAGPKGAYTFFSGSDLSVMKASRNKDAAWRVVAYLTGRDPEVKYSQKSAMLPARLDAANDPQLTKDRDYRSFVSAIGNGRHYASIPGWGPLESVYVKGLGSVFDIVAGVKGKYTPEAVKHQLDLTVTEANDVLSQAR
ncbi:MAG: sugar ABC transporter substrate-binding protein [Burkholderiales bacterium]|nr:sugar ABC transporter substrate-binding protein [Burkholderiales bacterium]